MRPTRPTMARDPQNLAHSPKPWLTKGILKSIEVKNKTYKQFCKSTDPLKKNELHIKFKTYRNSVVNLTHQCKEDYFKSYFENNKKKLKRNMEQHQKPYKHKKILKKHNKLP